MLAVYVLGLVVLVAVSATGLGVLRAGRELDGAETDEQGRPVAPRRSVAAVLDASVHRTRVAVDDLVELAADPEELRPSAAAGRDRAHTYTVIGTALLGLGAALVIGLLLLL